MELWSISGVLLVVIICIITIKFILPRLTWRTLFRWVIRLIVKPAKKVENWEPDPEIGRTWEDEKKRQGVDEGEL